MEECVAAGTCEDRRPNVCNERVLEVGRRGAIEFCQWRGKRLPTWAEWVRAARGDSKLVSRNGAVPCEEIEHNKERLTRCSYTGPTGMLFSLTTHWHGEWTSEADCYEINGDPMAGVLEVTVGLDETTLSRASARTAAFRCVGAPRK